jgi:type IV pilus assembly protein PilB
VSGLTVYRAAGCQACNGIGYRGRIALYEVLRMTDRVISAIGSPATELEALAISEGMLTLRDDAVRLVVAGITTPDEVRRVIGSKTRGD